MRGVVVLCLLILCAPVAGAAWSGGALQSISARSGTLHGTEVVLTSGNEFSDGGPPMLELQAERIVATLTILRRPVAVDELGGISHGQEHEWENQTWHDVSADGTERRAQYRLLVAGTGTADIAAHRLSVDAHRTATAREPQASSHNKELLAFNVSRLHDLTQSGGRLDLTGDFVVSLWEWDALLQNATTQRQYWTGQRYHDAVPGTPLKGDEQRRLYLQVTNGTLSLPLATLEVTSLFVAGGLLDAASAVLHVAGQETSVRIPGPLHLGLRPVRDGAFTGTLLDAGDAAPAAAPPATGPGPAVTATTGGAPWATGVALVALTVAALVAWRTQRVVRLRRAMRDGDYRAVADGAGGTGLESSRRFGPEVVVARAVSMVKTGEFAAAAALLERHGDRLATAVRAYLWACVHAGRGEVDEARDAVVRSLLADPGMAVEVESNRSLRRFLRDTDPEGYG